MCNSNDVVVPETAFQLTCEFTISRAIYTFLYGVGVVQSLAFYSIIKPGFVSLQFPLVLCFCVLKTAVPAVYIVLFGTKADVLL